MLRSNRAGIEDMEEKKKVFIIRRLWPFLVSLGGAIVMILAFFIPSIQDQWDRYQARQIIEQYEHLGDTFFDEERFDMAEKAFDKAFELSEQRRLDIEMKKLHAKISRISQDPWGSKPPTDLQDVDFQFLLHLQTGKEMQIERISVLNSYGIFLNSLGRIKEAEEAFEEAIGLDAKDVLAYVNLGNLYDQIGRKSDAEKSYLKAISLEPDNERSHYNLGLFYSSQGRLEEAEKELTRALELNPKEVDAQTELMNIQKRKPK